MLRRSSPEIASFGLPVSRPTLYNMLSSLGA